MSNYRQPRKPTQYQYGFSQDWGKIWGFLLCLGLGAGFLIWPAAFFHGQREDPWTGKEHWAWDIHSTIAVGTWWGILLAAGLMFALLNADFSQLRNPEESPPDFPDLRHLHGNPFLDPPEGIHSPF